MPQDQYLSLAQIVQIHALKQASFLINNATCMAVH